MPKSINKNREKLLWNLISKIQKNIDIKKIKKIAVKGLSDIFKADRCTIIEYDENQHTLPIDSNCEYLSSKKAKSMVGIDLDKEYDFWNMTNALTEMYLKQKQSVIYIPNSAEYIRQNNLLGSKLERYCTYSKFTSCIGVSVFEKNKIKMFFTVKFRNYTPVLDEDIEFIKVYAEQIYIAIKQNQIISNFKQTSEKEKILRKIVNLIRNSFDNKKMTKTFVFEVGKHLGASRAFFSRYDSLNNVFLTPEDHAEYLISPEMPSYKNFGRDFGVAYKFFNQLLIDSQKSIIIPDTEDFIKKYNLENTKDAENIRNNNVGGIILFPVLHKKKLLGCYAFNYRKPNSFTQDDIDFITAVASQTAATLYQAELFEKNKRQSEREKILREMVNIIRKSLDVEKILNTYVFDMGKYLKADRIFFSKYDSEKKCFLIPDENTEYTSFPEIPSCKVLGESFDDIFSFTAKYLKKFKKNLIINDTKAFLKEHHLEETEGAKNVEKFKIGSAIIVPILYENQLLGGYSVNYIKPYSFSQEDVDFVKTISEQTSIALYQAKLFTKIKKQAKNESLLLKIITRTAATFNVDDIKKTVRDIGKFFKADRCYFVEVDTENMTGKPVNPSEEYLSSPDIKTVVNYQFPTKDVEKFINYYLSKKDIIDFDYEKIREENSPQQQGIISYANNFNLKSGIGIPFFYMNKLFAILCIEYVNEKIIPSRSDFDFLRFMGKQFGIAFKQIKLFEKEKKAREKEKLLNKIISSIRKSLDLNEMKKSITTQLGEYLNADRVVIHQLNPQTKEYPIIDEFSEYTSSDKIISYIGIDIEQSELFFFKNLFCNGKEILIPDFSEFLNTFDSVDEKTKNWLRRLGIKSDYVFPIKYQDTQIANLYITYDQQYRTLSKEELEDIRYLIIQIGLALNQSMTYQDLQLKIKQELLLRKVTKTIRGSLDIKHIKQKIVEELGKTLEADRCYLRPFDTEKNIFLAPDAEYLASDDIPSLKNVVPNQEGLRYFFEQVKTQDGIYPVEVTENFIIEHKAQNKSLDNYFKEANIKSNFAIPVWSKKGELTFLVLHYIHKSFHMTDEIRQLLIMLSKQISIALEQSDLYSEIKAQAEREKSIHKVIDIVRSSLDLNTILKNVCQELFNLFEVQRIFAGKINFSKRENYVEVTTQKNIKTFSQKDMAIFTLVAKYWEDYLKEHKTYKIIDDIKESDLPENIKQAYFDLKVKSLIALPIKSKDEIWGGLFLSSIDNYKKWTATEISFLESILTQLDTAIRQAELYNFQKNTAQKESILRNLISEIKLTININQAYNKLLEILTQIFGINRAVFLEHSKIFPEELQVKFEYITEKKFPSIKDIIFSNICNEKFYNLINNHQTITIDNTKSCKFRHSANLFEEYKIKSIMGIPLIKEDRTPKVLGFILLCSNEIKYWTTEEIELANTVSSSVANVLWEILKLIEIEDLRNSFVLTLAHDFQVPLVGEKLAIEYLLEDSIKNDNKNKDILEEILENNKNIITLLNKSVEIYNYDAGKKILTKEIIDISNILNNIAYILKDSNKNTEKIEVQTSLENLYVDIDKDEIIKVLSTIIENAIEHSPKDEPIKINYYSQNKKVLISIHNKGKAIPKETQEIIFNRYEMALAIERKIGAGTGLFLAKKIIEAHNGYIWFETSDTKGTTFFISLPLVKFKT